MKELITKFASNILILIALVLGAVILYQALALHSAQNKIAVLTAEKPKASTPKIDSVIVPVKISGKTKYKVKTDSVYLNSSIKDSTENCQSVVYLTDTQPTFTVHAQVCCPDGEGSVFSYEYKKLRKPEPLLKAGLTLGVLGNKPFVGAGLEFPRISIYAITDGKNHGAIGVYHIPIF